MNQRIDPLEKIWLDVYAMNPYDPNYFYDYPMKAKILFKYMGKDKWVKEIDDLINVELEKPLGSSFNQLSHTYKNLPHLKGFTKPVNDESYKEVMTIEYDVFVEKDKVRLLGQAKDFLSYDYPEKALVMPLNGSGVINTNRQIKKGDIWESFLIIRNRIISMLLEASREIRFIQPVNL